MPLLELVRRASDQGASAIIIGCFDDTALNHARNVASCPVIGIGQAAYHMAAVVGTKFSVVTTMAVSVPILEANIAAYGLGASVARVRASNVPVLALHDNPAANEAVIAQICAAEREDDVQSVVLGCGGMVDLARQASAQTSIRLIDGVRAAAVIASTL